MFSSVSKEDMEGPTMVSRIERKSSIENEPRTLNISQMQFARDAAMYVLNTRTIEEAMRIFTEGLEPVVSVACQNNRRSMMNIGEEDIDCSVNELRILETRDIASAPF